MNQILIMKVYRANKRTPLKSSLFLTLQSFLNLYVIIFFIKYTLAYLGGALTDDGSDRNGMILYNLRSIFTIFNAKLAKR